jgi:Mg-chelatase subunit ChlD
LFQEPAVRRGRHALVRAAVGAAALLAAVSLATPGAAADTTPSRAEIYTALGLDDQPTDYVVLVDTSGSMTDDDRYDTVRTTLRPFLDGMSAEDHVALLTFDSDPEPRYVGSAGDTDTIMATLPDAPDPEGETDIGAALDSALDELERDDAAEVASVVLLTDGEHSPPDGSPYPESTGTGWTELHERAAALEERTELAGYALPLGDGATGAELLEDVVDDTTVLRPDTIEDLGAYLERVGDGTRLRRTGLLLAEDRDKGVTASWAYPRRLDVTDGSADAAVTLRSTTRHVPLTVKGLDASVPGESLRITGLPGTLTLAPGESRTFPVRLRGTLSDGPLPYRRDRDADGLLDVSGRVSSDWERALAPDVKLGVASEVRVRGSALPLRATVGSAVFLPAVLVGLVAVLLASWLSWRRTHRPRLRGELVLVPVFGGQLPDRVPLRGRRVVLRPQVIGGQGRVHGRRRSTEQGPRIDLLIRYTPDGSRARQSDATCGPGGQVVVNGVSFTHLLEQRADRVVAAEGQPR